MEGMNGLTHVFAGPGLHIAQSSLWITCAMSLAVFDIEKYVDGSGNVVEPETRYTGGGIRWVIILLSPDYAGDYRLVQSSPSVQVCY